MPRNYYDVLGIPVDASADDIKTAWRRAASSYHPDRGGDKAAMQEAEEAYACLGDPARRAEYDAAGQQVSAGPSLDEQADDLLAQLFSAAFDADPRRNLVVAVRTALQRVSSQRAAVPVLLTTRGELVKRREKIRTRAARRNVAREMLDRRIAKVDSELKTIEDSLRVAEHAETVLGLYEDDVPVPFEAPSSRKGPLTDFGRLLDGR